MKQLLRFENITKKNAYIPMITIKLVSLMNFKYQNIQIVNVFYINLGNNFHRKYLQDIEVMSIN